MLGKPMSKNFPDNHKSKTRCMIIVRHYNNADEYDLSARVKFVFTSWMKTFYNGEKESYIDQSEVANENSGCADSSFDS